MPNRCWTCPCSPWTLCHGSLPPPSDTPDLAPLQKIFTVEGEKTLPLNNYTVHWGYFSQLEQPKLTITSGETVTVEMASHHACDDYDKASPLLQACAHP